MSVNLLALKTWKEFIGCGTDASTTVYQHVTDIYKDLLLKQFSAARTREKEAYMHVQLNFNEKNALRYVGGCYQSITSEIEEIQTRE